MVVVLQNYDINWFTVGVVCVVRPPLPTPLFNLNGYNVTYPTETCGTTCRARNYSSARKNLVHIKRNH